MDDIRKRYLSQLPVVPLWVETRDLLSWEGSKLLENSACSGFVVWSPEDGSGSVVGEPEPLALRQAGRDVPELLAFADNIARVRSLLPGFEVEAASIFSAPELPPPAPRQRCREIGPIEISSQDHLPGDLRAQLYDVAEEGARVAAAVSGLSRDHRSRDLWRSICRLSTGDRLCFVVLLKNRKPNEDARNETT